MKKNEVVNTIGLTFAKTAETRKGTKMFYFVGVLSFLFSAINKAVRTGKDVPAKYEKYYKEFTKYFAPWRITDEEAEDYGTTYLTVKAERFPELAAKVKAMKPEGDWKEFSQSIIKSAFKDEIKPKGKTAKSKVKASTKDDPKVLAIAEKINENYAAESWDNFETEEIAKFAKVCKGNSVTISSVRKAWEAMQPEQEETEEEVNFGDL